MTLKSYSKITGEECISQLQSKAERFSKKHIVHVSSAYQGGGVAEILNSAVFLLNELGMKAGWRIIHGTPDFFTITKKFHNALQGDEINLSERKKQIYYDTNRMFSVFTHIDHDLVVVHDPQPLPMIDFCQKKQPWIFRCHIDLSSPNPVIWNYMKPFIEKYDHFVVSRDIYKKELSIPQSIIYPAIDPLSPKNKALSDARVERYLAKHGIDNHRPIISQVSRFDKWKDPLGVIKVFESVRRKANCQLVLLGSFAEDDPEGHAIFESVKRKIQKSRYKDDMLQIPVNNHILANCLQRKSAVVVQKSIKEGFGLTVSEALYKGTPVVASNVGGIPLQVTDKANGFLHDPRDSRGFASSILKLLGDDKLRAEFGKNGREHVKKNFLITRLISDWLDLFGKYLK